VNIDHTKLPWYGKVKKLQEIADSHELSFNEKVKLFLLNMRPNTRGELIECISSYQKYSRYWRKAKKGEEEVRYPIPIMEIRKKAFFNLNNPQSDFLLTASGIIFPTIEITGEEKQSYLEEMLERSRHHKNPWLCAHQIFSENHIILNYKSPFDLNFNNPRSQLNVEDITSLIVTDTLLIDYSEIKHELREMLTTSIIEHLDPEDLLNFAQALTDLGNSEEDSNNEEAVVYPWNGYVKNLKQLKYSDRDIISFEDMTEILLLDYNNPGSEDNIARATRYFNIYKTQFFKKSEDTGDNKPYIIPIKDLQDLIYDYYMENSGSRDAPVSEIIEFNLKYGNVHILPSKYSFHKSGRGREELAPIAEQLKGKIAQAGLIVTIRRKQYIITKINLEPNSANLKVGKEIGNISILAVELTDPRFVDFSSTDENNPITETSHYPIIPLKKKVTSISTENIPDIGLDHRTEELLTQRIDAYIEANGERILLQMLSKERLNEMVESLVRGALAPKVQEVFQSQNVENIVEYLTNEALKAKVQTNN